MPHPPIALAHRRLGPASAKTVAQLVLTHANGFCKEMWYPMLDQLAKMLPGGVAYDCVLMDLTGHGESRSRLQTSLHQRPLELQDFGVRDVIEGLDRIGPVAPGILRIGLGHSLGAGALTFAAIERPDAFDALVLMEPILSPDRKGSAIAPNTLADAAAKRRSVWPSREEAYRLLRAKEMYSRFDPRVFDLFIAHGLHEDAEGCKLKCSGEVEAEIYRSGLGDSVWPLLAKVRCPVWLFCGRDSVHMAFWGPGSTIDVFSTIATKFSVCKLELLEGANHFAPFEQPEQFAKVALNALQNVTALPANKAKL